MPRAVYDEAIQNIKPGVMSPMNATTEYQSLVTSIAKNTQKPPDMCVSDDGMDITYKEETLNIPKWRAGLRRLLNEAIKMLDKICLGKMFGLDLNAKAYDDWGNDHRGYSWTKNGEFIKERRSLLATLLKKHGSDLATVDEAGELNFKQGKVWEIIHECDKFNEMLRMLVMWTPGQTPRDAESAEHKFANSIRP